MKGMASVQVRECPPSGLYPFNITAASPGFTNERTLQDGTKKGGDSQIELSLEVAEGPFAGYPAFDNLGTDGTTKFGAASKKRLRQLDVQGLDSDAEIPDEIIAQGLLGRRVYAQVEREQQMSKDESGKLAPRFDVDEKTGAKIPMFRLRILGYVRQPTGATVSGAVQTQPQQTVAPQAAAPQLPAAPQLAPAGWPGATGGYAPPVPGAVPGGYAPQMAPGGYPQVAAPPGWVPQNGAPQGLPQAPGTVAGPGFPFPGAPGAPRVG